jgi:hypothetical protein
MKNQTIIRDIKLAARNRYAWPGGYPLILVMTDGACLCTTCARTEFKLIARATRDNDDSGWGCAGVEIYWEGPDMTCAHCNALIPSAYDQFS